MFSNLIQLFMINMIGFVAMNKPIFCCFPCLLFGGESEWTTNGISKLKNIQPKIIKHQHSQKHLNNVVSLFFLGKVNITNQLSEGHRQSIDRHNELVKINRAMLSKIIDCILFCSKFELPWWKWLLPKSRSILRFDWFLV